MDRHPVSERGRPGGLGGPPNGSTCRRGKWPRLGLEDGEGARVHNERGELTVSVKLDRGIRPGCVAMTNGWWISQGGTVNFLSPALETDMGYGAAFHENRVKVERAR